MINHFPKGHDPRDGQRTAIKVAETAIAAGRKYVVIDAPVGCHRKGTKVLMADGTTKCVEDVEVGDRLLGTNGKFPTVLSLARGVDTMYKVTPVKGEAFYCNGNHILSLAPTPTGKKYESNTSAVNVSITEYLQKSKYWRKNHKLYRSDAPVFLREDEPIEMPPYILGLWLGDGCISQASITSPDIEIVNEVYRYAKEIGHHISIYEGPHKTCPSYRLSKARGVQPWNKDTYLNGIFKSLGLYMCKSGDKFVPDNYKFGDIFTRREVLAGLLDTDGYLRRGGYDYISKSKQLAEDVAFLARSLGLAAYVKECVKGCQTGHYGVYHRVSISGDSSLINLRIARKRSPARKQKKRVNITGFSVELVSDKEDYFGFSIDENNLYMLHDFTVTHNCGKSDVAMTISNALGNAYVIMPKVSLQRQYQQSFEGDVRLVQGRSRIPCTYERPDVNRKVIKIIESGGNLKQPSENTSCATAPCMNVRPPTRDKVVEACKQYGKCPYTAMIDEACKHSVVVGNYHSMLFGALSGNLQKRKVLVVDEAHALERMLRDFLTIQFTIYRPVKESELIGLLTPEDFYNFLVADEQYQTLPRDARESYLARLEKFQKGGETTYGKQAIVKVIPDPRKTVFEFTPAYVGNAAHTFFFDYADVVVFMSGTIGGLEAFASPLGVKASECAYAQLPSDFPAENRPVVRPRKAGLDLSHKAFEHNFDAAVKEIRGIMAHHSDVKGLIHAPNYKIAARLVKALADTGRMVGHTPDDLQSQLDKFFESDAPLVFVSPSVREGVDFHGDRARFQIILRPPNPPATEPYFKWLLAQNRWDSYFRAAYLEYGQMLGRPVRSRDDWAVTYLLSSTFDNFLNKTWALQPDWLKKGYVR